MKKVLSAVTVLVMALVICSVNVSAAEKPTFTLTTKDKFNSGTVSVSVKAGKLGDIYGNITVDILDVQAFLVDVNTGTIG